MLFLSTLSLRRATGCRLLPEWGHWISIHALLAESDALKTIKALFDTISIHALLAESDTQMQAAFKGPEISIHALLAESDVVNVASILNQVYFYPRSPCGERPVATGQN